MPKNVVSWSFVERREYDGRSYGNSALYATPQSIPSLVRETGQNSLDAAVGHKPRVHLRYALIDLPYGSLARNEFLAGLHYEIGLSPHLMGAAAGNQERQTAARLSAATAFNEPLGSTSFWINDPQDREPDEGRCE